MISLYPDQEELLREVRKAYSRWRTFVIMAPTGYGKTRTAARILEGCVNAGMKVRFTVPRVSLLEQTEASFHALGLTDTTIIQGDREIRQSAAIHIASIQTLIRRENNEDFYDLTIVDECHKRYQTFITWLTESNSRYIGVSATPYGPWMGDCYQGLVKAKSMEWLINNGRLSPYVAYSCHMPDLDSIKPTTVNEYGEKDYKDSDVMRLMDDPVVIGDIVTNWLEFGEDVPTMALCTNILHAHHICNEFNKAGVSAEVITSRVKLEDREPILDRARSGVTRVLCSVDCLTEGVDIPQMTCLINARITASKARWVQGAGRVLRYVEGKLAKIFDHCGTISTLGRPEQITIDELGRDGKPPKQAEKKEREKVEKLPNTCPACKYVKPYNKPECEMCGFVALHGEDVPTYKKARLERIDKQEAEEGAFKDTEKQVVYSQLWGYVMNSRNRGKWISDGWVAHTYREIFGVWPRSLERQPLDCGPKVRNFIRAKSRRFADENKGSSGRQVVRNF
jgi:superfamily II DNA or RNA helicase